MARFGPALLFLAGAVPATQPAPRGDAAPIRGIVVSTHGRGRDWATPRIGEAFDELRAIGANWVCVHPYAGISDGGAVRNWHRDPEEIARPIREAHARGLQIFVNPHLAHWGTGFRWRGEIDFGDDRDKWERFWHDYRAFIAEVAEIARDADGFAVGNELDRTLRHENEWRDLVAVVRQTTGAALTYAANWTDYRRVPFWDALDVIGIQAYFPLVDDDEHAAAADPLRLAAGWRRRVDEVADYAARHNRRVVFTELGYDLSFRAAVEPWRSGRDGSAAAPLQEACMRAGLASIAGEARIAGVFLWKWFPPPRRRGRDFPLATDGMIDVIREAWGPATSSR